MRKLGMLAGLAGAGVGLVFAIPASTPPIRGADGEVVAGSIATIEPVSLGGVTQWLVLRGRDRANPVLLFLHGGPGTPESAWLAHYNRGLEDDFVVVSWEQRGAGKSYPAGRARPASMSTDQLVADTLALTGYLKERFDQDRIYLVGHSWGTLLGIRAAVERPDDYHALVSIAQVSHAAREEAAIQDWVLGQAREHGDEEAVRQLESLDPAIAGRLSLDDLSVRLKWVNRYGGGVMHRPGAFRELGWVVARSRIYTTWEKLRYFRAERFSLDHLYDDLASLDLFADIPAVDLPVYFVHGRHDYQVPMEVARDYYDALEAPSKRFVVFDAAAHSPLFEDPERFHRLMREVLEDTRRSRRGVFVPRTDPIMTAPTERSTP